MRKSHRLARPSAALRSHRLHAWLDWLLLLLLRRQRRRHRLRLLLLLLHLLLHGHLLVHLHRLRAAARRRRPSRRRPRRRPILRLHSRRRPARRRCARGCRGRTGRGRRPHRRPWWRPRAVSLLLESSNQQIASQVLHRRSGKEGAWGIRKRHTTTHQRMHMQQGQRPRTLPSPHTPTAPDRHLWNNHAHTQARNTSLWAPRYHTSRRNIPRSAAPRPHCAFPLHLPASPSPSWAPRWVCACTAGRPPAPWRPPGSRPARCPPRRRSRRRRAPWTTSRRQGKDSNTRCVASSVQNMVKRGVEWNEVNGALVDVAHLGVEHTGRRTYGSGKGWRAGHVGLGPVAKNCLPRNTVLTCFPVALRVCGYAPAPAHLRAASCAAPPPRTSGSSSGKPSAALARPTRGGT